MDSYMEKEVGKKVQAMKEHQNLYGVGRVMTVKNYILEVAGLDDVTFYEKVIIGGHSIGYVNNIRKNCVYVAVIRKDSPIYVGDEVVATGEEFTAEYSMDSIGHMIDMLGNDLMTGESFAEKENIAIENPNTPIMDRGTVCRPLETGIAGIDLIYPIGKGQRQLIIGDKKTGKTQICLDTIVNQRGKDVLCIYIALGKTKKKMKEIYMELLKYDAMKYTIILASLNDDMSPVTFMTPYAGLAIAEKYMHQGRDVLVCIDDLSVHADVHREISLCIGKVPGRDAYPPDIFYTHSRLLEKGCQHKDGGSITILPVVETRGGDITGYISTNIISITDGQLVLSKKNFDRGEKPAINYGLSVSRLGGAVQTKSVKKLGAKVRRELLSYLETRSVYELANMDEMGQELQNKLKRGSRLVKALCQYKYSPMSEQEIIERFQEIIGE